MCWSEVAGQVMQLSQSNATLASILFFVSAVVASQPGKSIYLTMLALLRTISSSYSSCTYSYGSQAKAALCGQAQPVWANLVPQDTSAGTIAAGADWSIGRSSYDSSLGIGAQYSSQDIQNQRAAGVMRCAPCTMSLAPT